MIMSIDPLASALSEKCYTLNSLLKGEEELELSVVIERGSFVQDEDLNTPVTTANMPSFFETLHDSDANASGNFFIRNCQYLIDFYFIFYIENYIFLNDDFHTKYHYFIFLHMIFFYII